LIYIGYAHTLKNIKNKKGAQPEQLKMLKSVVGRNNVIATPNLASAAVLPWDMTVLEKYMKSKCMKSHSVQSVYI
jgi:hypothetical protein